MKGQAHFWKSFMKGNHYTCEKIHDADRRKNRIEKQVHDADNGGKPRAGRKPDGRGAGCDGRLCFDARHETADRYGQGGHNGKGKRNRDIREIHRTV